MDARPAKDQGGESTSTARSNAPRRGPHPISPVRITVAGDGSISALNARGGELPIATGWEGSGFNPIEMLLAAIGGCSAIDFTTVLARRGHQLSGLDIEVRARRAGDERLEAIEVRYRLPADSAVDEQDIEVARRLTADVLCTVSRTVEHSSPVAHLVVAQLHDDWGDEEAIGEAVEEPKGAGAPAKEKP